MESIAPHGSVAASPAAVKRTVVRLGWAGWFAKGVVYLLAGALAGSVVARSRGWTSTHAPDGEASPTGAIKEIATFTAGRVLLLALAAGLIIYAVWRAFTAFGAGGTGAEAVATRAGYVVSSILYVSFSLTAFGLARSPSQNPDGNGKVTTISARLLANPAGRWLLGLAGVAAVAAGLYRLRKGLTGKVQDDLNLVGLSEARRAWLRRLGMLGEIGRGIAMALIGFFLVRSAWDVNANEATGLDGALRRTVVNGWGVAMVALIAVGFMAYGVFCLLTVTRQQLRSPS